MEEWIIHEDCDLDNSVKVINVWPVVKELHKRYPNDCVFIDLSRVGLLFNEHGEPVMERWDSQNEFWTASNPLPINSIADSQEVVSLWNEPIFTKQEALLRQTQDYVSWMAKIRDRYPETTTMVVCQSVETIPGWNSMDELAIRLQGFVNRVGTQPYIPKKKEIQVPVLTCYLIQSVVNDSPPNNVILTTKPNSTYGWYCQYCGKNAPPQRCSKCPSAKTAEDFSKPGTWYCDASCQQKHWPIHKKTHSSQ